VTHGRTVWWAKDSGWWRREGIVELGEEFGPAGPAVLDWLSCEAKAQNDDGHVKSGFKAVARGAFVTPDVTCHVLSRSVQLGLVDDYEEAGGRFTCRISGWTADQERGRAAVRKSRSRAKPESVGHDERDTVTVGHGQSVTGQESNTAASAREPSLLSNIEQAQAVLLDVAGRTDADDVRLANLCQRFPDYDFLGVVRHCADYLVDHPDRPTMGTLHRFFDRAEKPAAKTTTERRGAALRELMRSTDVE
jgi:hypothetical protein